MKAKNFKVKHSRNNDWRFMHSIFVVQYQHETPNKNCDHMEGEEDEEKEKMSVVSTTNAIVDPWTVVVKGLQSKRIRTSISTNYKINRTSMQLSHTEQCEHLGGL